MEKLSYPDVGNKFTAGGIISAIAYYYEFTSIIDAA